MNRSDDAERRLEQWGSERPPAVDGMFANRLDDSLRQLARDRHPSRDRRPLWQPALMALSAVLLVVVGTIALTRSQDGDGVLVMASASRTEVVLPNGELVVGAAGLSLPDGASITVQENGSTVIGDVVLGPGSEAIVRNGQLEIVIDGSTTSIVVRRPSTTAAEPSPDESTSTRPSTSSTEPSASTTSVSTTTPPTTSATTRPAATPDRPSSTTTSTTPDPDPEVALQWTQVDGRVRLTWTYVGPPTLAGWEVIILSGDRSRTLAVIRDPEARTLTVERLDVPSSYVVIALDAEGATMVESEPLVVR